MIPSWAMDFVGIPYQSKGDSHIGVDCYGLARLVMFERYGKLLPCYSGKYITARDAPSITQAVKQHQPEWERLPGPQLGAVVIFNIRGYPTHMGLVLDDNYMIHTLAGHNSAVEKFTASKWCSRIEGFYLWP